MFVYKIGGQCGVARAGHTEAHGQAGLRKKGTRLLCGTAVARWWEFRLTADLQRRVVEAGSMQTYPSNPSLGKLLRAAGLISVTAAATGETETHWKEAKSSGPHTIKSAG